MKYEKIILGGLGEGRLSFYTAVGVEPEKACRHARLWKAELNVGDVGAQTKPSTTGAICALPPLNFQILLYNKKVITSETLNYGGYLCTSM